MGRRKARLRISVKDQASGKILKVELIPAGRMFRSGLYAVRIHGRQATKVPEANLTEVFDRLRRWVAGQV